MLRRARILLSWCCGFCDCFFGWFFFCCCCELFFWHSELLEGELESDDEELDEHESESDSLELLDDELESDDDELLLDELEELLELDEELEDDEELLEELDDELELDELELLDHFLCHGWCLRPASRSLMMLAAKNCFSKRGASIATLWAFFVSGEHSALVKAHEAAKLLASA